MDLNVVQGTKFISICDLAYFCDYNDYNVFEHRFSQELLDSIDKKIVTVYTHTHWVERLFHDLRQLNTDKKFVVVTHNSDHEINERVYNQKPENVIKWYSQNVNCVADNIESIPIGLENSRWFPELNKIQNLDSLRQQEKIVKNLLYVNHSVRSFPSEREEPYSLFANKSWCTLEYSPNGSNYNGYIQSLKSHKFTLSPRGNGIDTHRFWEALYLGTIPVVIKNINNTYYNDLPVVYVNKWSEVTEEFLNSEYERMSTMIYSTQKLSFDYWKNKIKNNENR